MFNDGIDAGAGLAIVVIGIIVGGIAFTALFHVSDQVVQNSGNPQLQTSYQAGKQMIDQAGNLQDGSDVANSVRNFGK